MKMTGADILTSILADAGISVVSGIPGHTVIDFALPDEESRRTLWDRCLGTSLPRSPDVDLDFCARQFELSGGNIRSIAVTAAYSAAASASAVTMVELMRATQREYRKLGRLCVRSEFGPWLDLLAA